MATASVRAFAGQPAERLREVVFGQFRVEEARADPLLAAHSHVVQARVLVPPELVHCVVHQGTVEQP